MGRSQENHEPDLLILRWAGLRAFPTLEQQQGGHMWTKPEYIELRFGFEVTMYIANR